MPAPAKHCLLVVDDEPDLVQSVQDLLRFDFRVLGATRAAEGLKLMKAEDVHIVMTDQRMPEMTGVEFLRALREKFPDTVRLLFTAYADLDAVTDAINQGSVYRYIAKPWEPQELKGVLKQAVEYYDLNAERKRLLQEVQDKNKQLEEANAELRQANELKRAFIRVASHELRTPLTIVMGLSELAQHAQGISEPLQDWIERIHTGSVRLNRSVDQMVKLLLAERFERPLTPKPVELPRLLNAAAEEVGSFISQRRQKLVRVIPDDLGIIQAEEDKLYDSVVQLLVNAIKFTPDGGTITLSGRRHEGNGVAIAVHDTGVGIDRVSAARLFDPFFTKFDVSRHSSGVFEFDRRGLGLGLTVVKAFVEMHGGRVHVDSEVGKGSTFTLTLPSQPPIRDAASGGGAVT
jgi:signal transduction histidine kinase